MGKHFLVVNGHPDPAPERFCAALSEEFAEGARTAGWDVHRLDAAPLRFRSGGMETSVSLVIAAEMIHAAHRLAIFFPLWFDAPPAPVQELLAQAALSPPVWHRHPTVRRLRRRTAQLIITMEMPAFMHRSMLRAGGRRKDGGELESLPGFVAADVTFVGSVGTMTAQQRQQWLGDIRDLGTQDLPETSPRRWLPNFGARAA